MRTSAGAHPPPRGPSAQPGVGQEARTLKPNSWPETGAAVTAAPGREEPSKRPAYSDSHSARSLHARARAESPLLAASAEPSSLRRLANASGRPPPDAALTSLGSSLGGGGKPDAQLPHPQVPDGLGSTWHTQDFQETTEPSRTPIPRKLGLGAPGRASCKGPL